MPVTGQRLVRRTLGRRLTRLRAATGKSRREVAEARLGISEPTLHRIETGKVPVTVANVRALCWLYGADESITNALAELALGTSQAEWWDANPVVPDWFKLYVGLEASASRIFSYDGEIVPGELQTEQYARAVFGAEQPAEEEAAERQVKLRLQRQKTLFARKPVPRMVTVLGEGVLTRPVGGEAVLQAPIEDLPTVSPPGRGPTGRSSAGRCATWPPRASASSSTSARVSRPRATSTRWRSRSCRRPAWSTSTSTRSRCRRAWSCWRATTTPSPSAATCAARRASWTIRRCAGPSTSPSRSRCCWPRSCISYRTTRRRGRWCGTWSARSHRAATWSSRMPPRRASRPRTTSIPRWTASTTGSPRPR